jgi:hypothetical protein
LGKCERVPGVYDWKWLDEIIDYAVANNIEPWLQPSYGNPAYPGGGGVNLLNSLMTSEEALDSLGSMGGSAGYTLQRPG